MNNSILGDNYSSFKTESSKEFPVCIDPQSHDVPKIFEKYEYPVSTWPVIISKEKVTNLEKLCIKIPALLQKIPELYFENDIKKMAEFYFGGNVVITEFALASHKKKIETGCRLDLVLAEDGFKILEVNVGSSIGGWQVQSFELAIRNYHPHLFENFHSKDTQINYIKFLADQIIKNVPTLGNEINIFIVAESLESQEEINAVQDFFDGLLQNELAKRGFQGKSYIGAIADLSLHGDRLLYKNIEMNSVLVIEYNIEGISSDVFRAFMKDKIYFPDHLAISIYGDKRNLGLLRTLAQQQKFTPEENELVLNGIPWTQEMDKTKSIYKGKEMELEELLRNQKDNFVIKSAQGFQGKDVFIGKFSSDAEWEEAIKLGRNNTNFIAQEFSDSMNYLAPNMNNQWTPHKLIWGAFGFGKNYGGVWVRMSEVANDVGIINSATGAVEAIVYESLA